MENNISMKKVNIIKYTAMVLVSLVLFFVVYNDYGFYDKPIAKIIEVQEVSVDEKSGALGAKEQYYTQNITGEIMNLELKGKTIKLENTYAKSLVYDEKYHVGNSVFIENLKEEGDGFSGTISGLKRDCFVAGIVLILLNLLMLVGGKQGFYTILCMLVNSVMFFFMIVYY